MSTLSLAAVLAEAARRYPEKIAVVDGALRVSYRQLWLEARQYAAGLRELGIRPGDTVAVLAPNVIEFPRAYYGALAAGAIVVPVHLLLTATEAGYVLRDSGSTLLVCHSSQLAMGAAAAAQAGIPVVSVGPRPDLEPASPSTDGGLSTTQNDDHLIVDRPASINGGPGLGAGPGSGSPRRLETISAAVDPVISYASRAPEDPAVIFYTSGTTGEPKGALLTHLNLVMNAMVNVFDANDAKPQDVVLGCLPLFHTYGQTVGMNGTFRIGATLVLLARFSGDAALEIMQREQIDVFHGVPTMYIGLLDAISRRPPDQPLPRLRLCVSGGASLPLAVLERFSAAFDTTIYEGYGLSETSPTATTNQPHFGVRAGTVGHPVWGVEARIARAELDDRIELLPDGELGEIVIRGHNVFAGYLGRPEATAQAVVDGWFRTGDLGTCDADGFISIVDRKKDIVIRGGFNVYPREVEEVLVRHPAIAQVAVIGVPDPVHGEEVCAVVVLDDAPSDGTQRPSEADLIAWSSERLGRHKYPRRFRFVDELPLGPSHKVLKRVLRDTV